MKGLNCILVFSGNNSSVKKLANKLRRKLIFQEVTSIYATYFTSCKMFIEQSEYVPRIYLKDLFQKQSSGDVL